MNSEITRFCPICGLKTQAINFKSSFYNCSNCKSNFSVKESILLLKGSNSDSQFIDQAIRINQGEEMIIRGGKKITKSYTRFRTEKSDDQESNFSVILKEGLSLWKDSIGKLALISVFLFLVLYAIFTINQSIIMGNQLVADFVNIDTKPMWSGSSDLLLLGIPLLLTPLLNPLNWAFYIILTIGLGLIILIMHQTIYTTPTAQIRDLDVLKNWIDSFPRLIIVGIGIGLTNLLLFDNGKFLLDSFEIPFSVFIGVNLVGTSGTPGGFIVWAIFAFVFFPIWMLTQVLLFLAVQSAVLTKNGSLGGIGYSEILVRGQFQKILKFLILKTLIVYFLLVILQGDNQNILFSQFITGDPVIQFTSVVQRTPITELLIIPILVIIFSLLSSWQLIMFEESHRRFNYLKK